MDWLTVYDVLIGVAIEGWFLIIFSFFKKRSSFANRRCVPTSFKVHLDIKVHLYGCI